MLSLTHLGAPQRCITFFMMPHMKHQPMIFVTMPIYHNFKIIFGIRLYWMPHFQPHLSLLSSNFQSWSIPTHFLYITIDTFSWLKFLNSMKCLKMFQFCLIGHILPLRMFIKAVYLSIHLTICFERDAYILLSDHDRKLLGCPWGYITL